MRSDKFLKKLVRTMVLAMVLPFVIGLVYSDYARAAKDDEKNLKYKDTETRQRQSVGQNCAKSLEAVQKDIEKESWSQAEKGLRSADGTSCKSSYERSQLWNFLGYVYYSLERYKDAIASYQKVIHEPDTDDRVRNSTYYTVAQLYFVVEDYANAARQLESWMRTTDIVDPDGKILLAQAYYQLNRKKDSLRLVEEVIRETEGKGDLPKEGWWGLQRVLYYEMGDYKKVVQILHKLVKHYPKMSYWRQMGGMYNELDRELDQLVTTDLVYLMNGLTTDRQYLALTYMYMGAEAPYRAAVILDKAIKSGDVPKNSKNLELLGTAWQQAQEFQKATVELERAAKLSKEGEIYARLAGVYLDVGESAKAIKAARNALQRPGSLKRPDQAYMVMGNALLERHCYLDAIKSFKGALNDKRSAKYARQWIEYADREGNRRRKLIEQGAKIAGCSRV